MPSCLQFSRILTQMDSIDFVFGGRLGFGLWTYQFGSWNKNDGHSFEAECM